MKKPQKLKKIKRPKLPRLRPARRAKRRQEQAEERVSEALSTVPRITNETVAEHREEVLGSARKYIYPLRHSKHRVVRISISLLAIVIIAFFAYCGLALYKFRSTSGFIYGVTRVVPFPVAKAGSSWISYEAYLFELRRDMHYYTTQQQVNFSTSSGKAQLARLKTQTMDQVIQDAYVDQLASQNHVSVSNTAVDNEVTLVRSQNRLGSSDRVFKEVLDEFWGWNENDFKRELKQQMLQQAVVAKLDTATNAQAQSALKQLEDGGDFAILAGQVSDDASTKGNGGQYPAPVTPSDPNIAPQIIAELFQLKPGQVSTIINTGYTLEILKVISQTGDSLTAAHIQFTFQPITTYTGPLQTKHPPHTYIDVKL